MSIVMINFIAEIQLHSIIIMASKNSAHWQILNMLQNTSISDLNTDGSLPLTRIFAF